MAGLSSRFAKAGYEQPKYMLPLNGGTLFHHSLDGFKAYFETEPFLFIGRDILGTEAFIREEVKRLGIKTFEIVMLPNETRGQAETVYNGIMLSGVDLETDITIFNIDTFRRDFRYPGHLGAYDGYLEVFEGSGANWSYIRLDENDPMLVSETAEKRPISNLCCTGLYNFKRSGDFIEAFEFSNDNKLFVKNELYVAPLYNYLISKGRKFTFHTIETNEVLFCGIPEEYTALMQKGSALFEL